MKSSITVHVETAWRDMDKVRNRGDIVVVVDVLRASTTIVNIFANGGIRVYPVETVPKARIMKEKNSNILLCGERGGLKPSGFDLGNSPLEYTPEVVDGRWIVMTTTDGTKAMNQARGVQKPVLIGACTNSTAVARKAFDLAEELGSGISIVAVGRKGEFSLEDFLGGGLIVKRLPEDRCSYSDTALAAMSLTEIATEDFLLLFNSSSHARELREIGLGKDVDFASRIDKFEVVPILNRENNYFEST